MFTLTCIPPNSKLFQVKTTSFKNETESDLALVQIYDLGEPKTFRISMSHTRAISLIQYTAQSLYEEQQKKAVQFSPQCYYRHFNSEKGKISRQKAA